MRADRIFEAYDLSTNTPIIIIVWFVYYFHIYSSCFSYDCLLLLWFFVCSLVRVCSSYVQHGGTKKSDMYPSSTTPHSNDGNGNGTLHLSRNRYSSSQDLCNAPLRQSHSYSDLSGYASPHSPPPPTPPLAAATGAQGRQGSMEHSHPADANSSLNKAHAYISKLERQLEEANRRMHGLEQELEEERQARLALEQVSVT